MSTIIEDPNRWMQVATGELNKRVKEYADPGENPRIVMYLQTCTNLSPSETNNDETPWCSAFVNWCLKQAGIAGTNHALASSWKTWGQATIPKYGAIVVLNGHVGFFVREVSGYYEILGGNQSDAVTLARYSKSSVLACRWPN